VGFGPFFAPFRAFLSPYLLKLRRRIRVRGNLDLKIESGGEVRING